MPYHVQFLLSLFLGLAVVATPLCASASSDEKKTGLILTVHTTGPDRLKRFQPLADYLSKHLGVAVSLSAPRTSKEQISRIANNVDDLAYLSPLAYAMLGESRSKFTLLAREARHGVPFIFSHIVVRKDSRLVTLNQLSKTKFAFESPDSTMGYMVPRFVLLRAGIGLGDLSSHAFLGSSRNIALGILMGDFQAGAIREWTYKAYQNRGLTSLDCSPPISSSLYVAGNRVQPALA